MSRLWNATPCRFVANKKTEENAKETHKVHSVYKEIIFCPVPSDSFVQKETYIHTVYYREV
jgi:hypothetical protein